MTHVPPKDEQPDFTDDEVEASRAPLLEHLVELRRRDNRDLVPAASQEPCCRGMEVPEIYLARALITRIAVPRLDRSGKPGALV